MGSFSESYWIMNLLSLAKATSKSIHFHIRAFRHFRHGMKEDITKTVVCALVGSRLGSSKHLGKEHQQAARATGIVSPGSLRCTKAPPMLEKLHWLPHKYHVDFKNAVPTFNSLTTRQPINLSSPIATSSTFSWRQCSWDTKRQDHHWQLRVQVCGSVSLERLPEWT